MEIAAVALGIIASIVDMVKQAKNASAEKSAEIAARFTAAEAALKGAADEAHAELDAIKSGA
jgi:Cu/Ag efflux protein CusF